jgi:hypothetical protein
MGVLGALMYKGAIVLSGMLCIFIGYLVVSLYSILVGSM